MKIFIISILSISMLFSADKKKVKLPDFSGFSRKVEVKGILDPDLEEFQKDKNIYPFHIEEIKKKTQELVQSSMKLGEAVYKSQQSAKPDNKPKDNDKKEEGKKDDNVVDADFEEVKDENKEKSA